MDLALWISSVCVHFMNIAKLWILDGCKNAPATRSDKVRANRDNQFGIQQVVKNNFVLLLASKGLKQICEHEGPEDFQWSDDDSGLQWPVVKFVKYRLRLSKNIVGR